MNPPTPLDLSKLKVYPLAQRKSLSQIHDILVNPDTPPPACDAAAAAAVESCARQIAAARKKNASVMLM